MATPAASGADRFTSLVNTLPLPNSQNSLTPSAAMQAIDSRQRTVIVTWSMREARMSSGLVSGVAVTLATSGTEGGRIGVDRNTPVMMLAAGFINAQWKGALTDSR